MEVANEKQDDTQQGMWTVDEKQKADVDCHHKVKEVIEKPATFGKFWHGKSAKNVFECVGFTHSETKILESELPRMCTNKSSRGVIQEDLELM